MTASQSQESPSRPRPGLRGPLVLGAVFGVMGLMTFGAVVLPTLAAGLRQPELEIYGTLPDFELRDQTGAVITPSELRGHVIIASFIFTRCPTVCPLMTMKMRRVQDRTADAREAIKLLSFSVDPAHDTPAVLAEYAAGHGADPARWRFLTEHGQEHDKADGAVVRRIAEALMLALEVRGQLPNGAPDLVHAEHFVLLDPELRIRGYYDTSDARRIERMLRDARRLLPSAH